MATFHVTSLLTNLIAPVRGIFATQCSRLAKLVEPAIGLTLWFVPLAFWTIVIRFVIKHYL
jgi:hypothetical protein